MTTYITQEQAVALARAQKIGAATSSNGVYFVAYCDDLQRLCNAAIQAYIETLVAGVVLPKPVAHVSDRENCKVWWSDSFTDIKQAPNNNTPLHTADQLRQAIADELAKHQESCVNIQRLKDSP